MERRARITVILAAIALLFVMLPAFAGQPLTASAQDTIAAPASAEIAVTTSEAGRVMSVPATWSAVEGAAGYYLTLCRIENGKWVEASDQITVESTEGQDTVSYDLKEYVDDFRGGIFGYKVRAYNSSGLTSGETKSSNTVEIYHISMGFQYTGISFIVAAGSNISALIKEAFETHIVSDFSIEDGEYYWYYHGEDHKILCFTKDRQYKYSSLAEMKAAALYVPGEDPKPAVIEKDQKVEAFSEDMLCEKTGDLHKWKGDVIRATTESSGHAVYTCEDCDASEEGEYYPRVAGFELEKSSYTFTGKAITPAVKVSDIYTEESGEYLREGKDYTVKYTNNTKAGTGKAEITLIGYYEGKATLTFRIKKADLSSAEISSIPAKTYKGKAIKPVPGVKLGGVKLKNGTEPVILEITPRLDGCHMWNLIKHYCGADLLDACFRHLLEGEAVLTDNYVMPDEEYCLEFMSKESNATFKGSDFDTSKAEFVCSYYKDGDRVLKVNGYIEKCGYMIYRTGRKLQ